MNARLLLLGTAVLAAACTNFDEVSNVKDLRVLAIATDPSEVILKIDGLPDDPGAQIDPTALSVNPASIRTIHVTPLLADPPAGRAVTWSLVACPNNPYGAGPPANMGGGPDPSGGARTTVGSTLCPVGGPNTWPLAEGLAAGATADVTFTPEQLLAAFKADIYVDQYGNFHGGFDLGMPVNLQLTATDGVSTVQAVKRVLFWAQKLPDVTLDDGQVVAHTPNRLPTIPVVQTYRERDEKTWDPVGDVTPLDLTTPVRVTLGTQLWLEPVLPDADREAYVTTVIARDPPHLAMPVGIPHERIRYAFYATAGHFDPARSVSETPVGVPGAVVHLESKYVPPASLDDVPVDANGDHLATIWIVARDDRGGEAWVQAQIALDAAPP